MKRKLVLSLVTAIALIAANSRAASFTATANGNWNLGATWGNTGNNTAGSGYPSSADDATIPSGITVTYSGSPSVVGAIVVNGTLSVGSAGTVGDFTVNAGGKLNPTGSGAALTFSGSVTNNGNWSMANLGSGTIYTYSGSGKALVGFITNVVASITGSYINYGTFVTAASGTQDAFKGAGSFNNQGTLILLNGQNTTASITGFDSSAVGSAVSWLGFNGTATPKAAAYYDLSIGHSGSASCNLSGAGLSIAHNLLVTNNGPVGSWPAGGVGGLFTYTVNATCAAYPSTFSVGGLKQTAGTMVIPANGNFTVTGSGNAWTRNGGTFNCGSGSTVKFTGGAPIISGSSAINFINLLLDSTATNASATGTLNVSNSLTLAAGASLDITGLTAGSYALTVNQSVTNSGTIKGTVTTASNSKAKLYLATDGGFGTCTVTANLTLGSTTNSVNVDVNSTAADYNDHLIVGGTLSLNNTTFNLKAPSAGAAIDTAADYTLVEAGNISGTPVLNWVTAPADSGNYSLVTTATTIKLHYAGVVSPGQPVLGAALSGNTLTLSWDSATYPGYSLQSQTGTGIGSSWSPVSGGETTPFPVTVNPSDLPTFYRLVHP